MYVALEHLVPSGVTGLKLATAKYQFPRYYGNVIWMFTKIMGETSRNIDLPYLNQM